MHSGKVHVLIRQEYILHLSNTVLTRSDSGFFVFLFLSLLHLWYFAERLFGVASCTFKIARFETPAD